MLTGIRTGDQQHARVMLSKHICLQKRCQISLIFFPLQDAFISQLEIVVKKKNAMTVLVDEQWCSEKEMKDDLGWSTSLV